MLVNAEKVLMPALSSTYQNIKREEMLHNISLENCM